MRVTILAAVAENGVIGRDGGLPWRLSSDLKRFKADTMGKPIIMGRKTWSGLGRPLPGRLNIVVSRDENFQADGAVIVHALPDAIDLATAHASEMDGIDEICIIGGGQIYAQGLPLADRLSITHVLTRVEGDTRFPAIDPAVWDVVSSQAFDAGEKDSHATRHAVYARHGASR